jgi:hypothetical protein
VVGKATKELEVVRMIKRQGVPMGKPKAEVKIMNCGTAEYKEIPKTN